MTQFFNDTPQKVYETREIDKHQSLESFIKDLNQAVADGYTSFHIKAEEYYGSTSTLFVVTRKRIETPEEIEVRRNLFNQMKESRRRQYEQLQREFGK